MSKTISESIEKWNKAMRHRRNVLRGKEGQVTEHLKCPTCRASMIHVPYSGVLVCSSKKWKHYTMYIKGLLGLGIKDIKYNDDRKIKS